MRRDCLTDFAQRWRVPLAEAQALARATQAGPFRCEYGLVHRPLALLVDAGQDGLALGVSFLVRATQHQAGAWRAMNLSLVLR